MAIFDIESLLDAIKTAIIDTNYGLNAKLLAIDAEKADGITLTPLDTANAISMLEQRKELTVYDPHLYMLLGGYEPLNPTQGGKNVKIELWFGIQDTIDGAAEKRILRYTRALSEIFEREWRRQAKAPSAYMTFDGFSGSAIKTKDDKIQHLLYTNINLRFAIG